MGAALCVVRLCLRCSEALDVSYLRPGDFNFTVARLGVRNKRVEELLGDGGHVLNGSVEGSFIRFRRRIKARQFANELQRSSVDLVFGSWRVKIKQRLNIAAHSEGSPLRDEFDFILLHGWGDKPAICTTLA